MVGKIQTLNAFLHLWLMRLCRKNFVIDVTQCLGYIQQLAYITTELFFADISSTSSLVRYTCLATATICTRQLQRSDWTQWTNDGWSSLWVPQYSQLSLEISKVTYHIYAGEKENTEMKTGYDGRRLYGLSTNLTAPNNVTLWIVGLQHEKPRQKLTFQKTAHKSKKSLTCPEKPGCIGLGLLTL